MAEPDTNTPEIWKPIPGLDGKYSASNLGRLRRDVPGKGVPAGHVLSTSTQPHGYRHTVFVVNGKRVYKQIHTLIAAAFLGPRPPGYHVNHKNADKADNRLENLEYCTQKENAEHAARHGLLVRGERHWRAKLTADNVREIRARYAKGDISQSRLAAEWGVCQHRIYQIVNRLSWKHIN